MSVVLSYLPYSLVTAFTPGPNNLLSLYAVSQNGWRRGKAVVGGIAAGFLCVMTLCALFCWGLSQVLPAVTGFLTYVGAAYILWLALHIARSRPQETEHQILSFWQGFWLQFVNPKIILCAVTILTGYVLPAGAGLGGLLLHSGAITAIGLSGVLTWAAAGGLFQRFLSRYYKPFNYLMALILVLCAWRML